MVRDNGREKKIYTMEFKMVAFMIENLPYLRPLDRKTPFLKNLMLSFCAFILYLIYLYIAFLVTQLCIFNIILIGILFIYFQKLRLFVRGLRNRYDYNYRNKPL